ncbi:MAG: homoserine kinase [Desulfurococcales archaeon]|nr:homoserine kinase [Desulfurococcales archaeon]
MPSIIKVIVHGSSANLGPGFDVFSISLETFTDEVEAWLEHDGEGVVIDRIEGPHANGIPHDKNTLLESARLVLQKTRFTEARLVLRLYKGVPPGKGLGSSGASAAAGAVAASILTGARLNIDELVKISGQAEAVVSGSPHYDNVTASLLGGFVVVSNIRSDLVFKRADLDALFLVAVPHVDMGSEKTRKMRSVIPERIPLEVAARQWGKTALMIIAATRGDLELFGSLMMSDEVVEPARSSYIPCYHNVRSAAIEAGALGVSVSGAGPSLLVLLGSSSNHADVEAVKKAVLEAYSGCGISVDVYVSRVGGGYDVLVSD